MECLGCKKEKSKQDCEEYNLYFRQLIPKRPSNISENLLLIIKNSHNIEIGENFFSGIRDMNLNFKLIERKNPMHKFSKKELKYFKQNIHNVKKIIIIFLLDPMYIGSDINVFVPLSKIFTSYKDKSLYCMSYILLNDNNEKFIRNNVNIDKILLLNEKNNIQHMYKVKKKGRKRTNS